MDNTGVSLFLVLHYTSAIMTMVIVKQEKEYGKEIFSKCFSFFFQEFHKR